MDWPLIGFLTLVVATASAAFALFALVLDKLAVIAREPVSSKFFLCLCVGGLCVVPIEYALVGSLSWFRLLALIAVIVWVATTFGLVFFVLPHKLGVTLARLMFGGKGRRRAIWDRESRYLPTILLLTILPLWIMGSLVKDSVPLGAIWLAGTVCAGFRFGYSQLRDPALSLWYERGLSGESAALALQPIDTDPGGEAPGPLKDPAGACSGAQQAKTSGHCHSTLMGSHLEAGSSSTTRCPICASPMDGDLVRCCKCATPHHPSCFAYSRRCGIYGCGGRLFEAIDPSPMPKEERACGSGA